MIKGAKTNVTTQITERNAMEVGEEAPELIALIGSHLACSVGINVLIAIPLMQFYNTKITRAFQLCKKQSMRY